METINPREIRAKLGLNQQQFWSRIGVTQSGGSRYESGRAMPRPVKRLLGAVYLGEQIPVFIPEPVNDEVGSVDSDRVQCSAQEAA